MLVGVERVLPTRPQHIGKRVERGADAGGPVDGASRRRGREGRLRGVHGAAKPGPVCLSGLECDGCIGLNGHVRLPTNWLASNVVMIRLALRCGAADLGATRAVARVAPAS
jgi:hypothetical protein